MAVDPIDVLKRIPWSVGAVENLMPQGSSEREAVRVLYNSVRAEIESAVAALQAERRKGED